MLSYLPKSIGVVSLLGLMSMHKNNKASSKTPACRALTRKSMLTRRTRRRDDRKTIVSADVRCAIYKCYFYNSRLREWVIQKKGFVWISFVWNFGKEYVLLFLLVCVYENMLKTITSNIHSNYCDRTHQLMCFRQYFPLAKRGQTFCQISNFLTSDFFFARNWSCSYRFVWSFGKE
jgi:hypothetical protein